MSPMTYWLTEGQSQFDFDWEKNWGRLFELAVDFSDAEERT
jgi:hypothetical protein